METTQTPAHTRPNNLRHASNDLISFIRKGREAPERVPSLYLNKPTLSKHNRNIQTELMLHVKGRAQRLI